MIVSCFECKFELLGADDMNCRKRLQLFATQEKPGSRVQTCRGAEKKGGSWGREGEIKIKIEARDASQSSAVHPSALTPQASKTSGAPNSTITAACPWPGS